ncbi:TPA: hypothetical protein DCW54_03260 [Candidatus Dependentiae bacterium]|nr:hypothetical protein [Candidatus Dependentiae bacterium]
MQVKPVVINEQAKTPLFSALRAHPYITGLVGVTAISSVAACLFYLYGSDISIEIDKFKINFPLTRTAYNKKFPAKDKKTKIIEIIKKAEPDITAELLKDFSSFAKDKQAPIITALKKHLYKKKTAEEIANKINELFGKKEEVADSSDSEDKDEQKENKEEKDEYDELF